jgi:hypothetical protein
MLVVLTLADGVRGAVKSERATKAATANATVVKKPKTFWMRVRELYILRKPYGSCDVQTLFSPSG